MNIVKRWLLSAATAPKIERIKVELFFDVISPYSYLQFEQLCQKQKDWWRMDLHFTPVFNWGIINNSGNKTGMQSCPNKGLYIVKDAAMIAQICNIPFGLPTNVLEQVSEYRNLAALRFLIALQPQVSPDEYESAIRSIYRSFFTEGTEIDLKDPQQILQFGLKAGLEESLVKKCLLESESDSVKETLANNIERAIELGAFGVPCTFVYADGENKDPELFWGSDRNQFIAPLLGA